MNEKSYVGVDQQDAIIVTATTTSARGDVGTAIEIMEAKLARSGISLRLSTPETVSYRNRSVSKLRLLPEMIRLSILAFIDSGIGSRSSVGTKVTRDALVPGNLVAFQGPLGGFLMVTNELDVMLGDPWLQDLPLECDSARFLVVDAGRGNDGEIALFSATHHVYLCCVGNDFATSGTPVAYLDDSPRAHESFQIKSASANTSRYFSSHHRDDPNAVVLYCDIEKVNLRPKDMTGTIPDFFRVYQIHAFH